MKKLLIIVICQITVSNLIFGQITGYEYRDIEEFDVYLESDALNNYPQQTKDAIDLLTLKLEEINNLGLLKEITDSLHSVKIFMDWNTTGGAAVYHPSLAWLIANGYIEEKEKSVEISNIVNFVNWSNLNQPYMVLHELAHAYHDRVLSFDYPPVMNSYDKAMQNSLYDWVSYHAGNGNYFDQQAYATTNRMEYFAELTEAYLGENDYFPFVRSELASHDTMGYRVVSEIWQFERSTNIEQKVNSKTLIYPNPTSDILNIEWRNTRQYDVLKVLSPDGRNIKNYPISGRNAVIIDVSYLSSGGYYILLDDKEQYRVIKSE